MTTFNAHQLYKFNPATNPKNVVRFRDYRLSVLTSGLIRIEKDPGGAFNNSATQFALFRNFAPNKFAVTQTEQTVIVDLGSYQLHFNGNLEQSHVVCGGKKIALNNDQNLGGTYQTVDGMDGEQFFWGDDARATPADRQIGVGVCSKNGVALIDDTNSYCLDDDLHFTHKNTNQMDVYLFFYPNQYVQAVNALYQLSGFPPQLPKAVLGNWWSRFYAYTQTQYLRLMEDFCQQNVPFTVATVDMDWHYSSTNGRNIYNDLGMDKQQFICDENSVDHKYYCNRWIDSDPFGIGWCGYTWNKKLFPNYREFLKQLHQKNLVVTLNVHPADGIAFYEEMYQKCAQRAGIDPSTKQNVLFDLTDEQNRKLFFEEIFHPYQQDGVDFWWIDWQQGDESRKKGLTPLYLCNHYFYLDSAQTTKNPVILSRYCGLGGQRYPIGFSGDSHQTFDSLKYLVKTTPMASNVGFPYWSHDVGGHMHGEKNGDLYLKFVQFATFSPILRLHSACYETFSKEPKFFLGGTGNLIAHYLRLRHKMIPMLHSKCLQIAKNGGALLQPMYYVAQNKKAYDFASSQYVFADSLLVAPYCDALPANGINQKKVYFPKHNYYDLKYGYKYGKNKVVNVCREQGDMPVFIKEGEFFLLDAREQGNDISLPQQLQVVTTFGKGGFVFYEQDDQQRDISTRFVNSTIAQNAGKIVVETKGKGKDSIKNRRYNFKVLNVFGNANVAATGGEVTNVYTEGDCLQFTVEAKGHPCITIHYAFGAISNLDHAKRNVLTRLLYVDDGNDQRTELYNQVSNAQTAEQIVLAIGNSKLKPITKRILREMTNVG